MTSTTSLADAKSRFSEIISSAETTHERTIVTKNGRPVAVLMSIDELESLEETLEILSDPDALADIRESRINRAHGYYYLLGESEAEVEQRMGSQEFAEARAAIHLELLAHGDHERAQRYQPR